MSVEEWMAEEKLKVLPFRRLESKAAVEKVEALKGNRNVSWDLVGSYRKVMLQLFNVSSFKGVGPS